MWEGGYISWQIPNKYGIPHICINGKWVEACKNGKKWMAVSNETLLTKSVKNMKITKTKKKIVQDTDAEYFDEVNAALGTKHSKEDYIDNDEFLEDE